MTVNTEIPKDWPKMLIRLYILFFSKFLNVIFKIITKHIS